MKKFRQVILSGIAGFALLVNMLMVEVPTVHAQSGSTTILDSFNRANGAPGANWSGATTGYAVASNRLDVGTGSALFWGTQFGSDQEVFVTLTTIDAAGSEQDLLLKSQSKTSWNSGVIEVWYDAVNKRVQVWTYSSAQGWVQRGTNISVTFVNGDTFGARARANGTVDVYRNGTVIASRDASAWTYAASGGYIGLWYISAGNAVVDDFGGGNVTGGGVTSTATASPLPTSTPTRTPTRTSTSTSTATFTNSPIPSTATATRTPSFTPTFTATFTATRTPSFTPTATPSQTATFTPTDTATPTFTPTDKATFTFTPSATPSFTATETASPTQSPSETPSPAPTFTETSTATEYPSSTPTWTPTDLPTQTPTEIPSETPTASPSNTPTETLSATPSDTPTDPPSQTPSVTPSDTPTITPTFTPTATMTATMTATPTRTPSNTPPPYVTGQNTYISSVDGRKGLLFLPNNYAQVPEGGWPLIMFIHGAGVVSNDPNTIRQEALPNKLDLTPGFPFIVISPLITPADGTGDTNWLNETTTASLLSLFEEIKFKYAVDPERVYLTGYSLGGGATWKLGLQFPNKFAAIAPAAGYYQNPPVVPSNICDLRSTPIRAYHGSADPIVPLYAQQNLVDAVNNCGGNAQLIVLNGLEHDIGAPVYFNTNELYDWMLQYRLTSGTATPTAPVTPTLSPTASLTHTPTATATRTPTITPTVPTSTPTATATPLGFPTTVVRDTFNRANGAPGSNWSGATSGYAISFNRLDVGSGGALFWTSQFGPDQEAFITLTTVDATGTEQNILLKSQSRTSWNSGVIEVSYSAANKRIQVSTYSSAQGWVQRGANISVTMVNGDQFGARARANGMVDVYRNGVLLATRDASAWTYAANGGYIGIWFYRSNKAFVDNFGGGAIVFPPTATPMPTATDTLTPTATATFTATTTPTNAATFTSTDVPPTVTASNTPDGTSTGTPTDSPTATPPPTWTPTPTAINTATPAGPPIVFPVGAGGSDVIPHQVVRTSADHLYLFAYQEMSSTLRAYRTLNPGLPNSAADFAPEIQVMESSVIISVDALYDGGTIIHVLVNLRSGEVKDIPFDTLTNTFKPPLLLASDGGTTGTVYVGTSGVTGMVDQNKVIHVAHWTNTNHIVYRDYTYDSESNTLTSLGDFFQVDDNGSANHPALAVSPFDNSVTVAWISQADSPTKIRARVRAANGTWGAVELASTYPGVEVWTSPDNGVNIDQGPSLLIDPSGNRHLVYIEAFNPTFGDYGRIHYVTESGSGWVDEALAVFSHDPALTIQPDGTLTILGHGHPRNTTGSAECISSYAALDNMCMVRKQPGGAWSSPTLLAVPPADSSFDSSVSVKWSAFGMNRPELVEYVFFKTPYNNPTLYYGRLP